MQAGLSAWLPPRTPRRVIVSVATGAVIYPALLWCLARVVVEDLWELGRRLVKEGRRLQ